MADHALDPRFAGYLLANRAFMAPAVERAVGSLGLAGATRILDAGTGAGGALAPLARAAAKDAIVLGVDLNPAVIALAAAHAEEAGVSARVRLRAGDVLEVLAESAAAGGTFDAIWAGDLVWPGNFDDPGEVVQAMAAALAPGGVVGLCYSNYYRAMFLPGHSRLERKLKTASELRWGLPGEGETTHYERHVEWLVRAGLRQVALQVFPRIGFPADEDPTVRPYLEAAVWPELRESMAARGTDAGMSRAEIAEAEQLLTPGSPRYVLDRPGYYLVHPAILAAGRR